MYFADNSSCSKHRKQMNLFFFFFFFFPFSFSFSFLFLFLFFFFSVLFLFPFPFRSSNTALGGLIGYRHVDMFEFLACRLFRGGCICLLCMYLSICTYLWIPSSLLSGVCVYSMLGGRGGYEQGIFALFQLDTDSKA